MINTATACVLNKFIYPTKTTMDAQELVNALPSIAALSVFYESIRCGSAPSLVFGLSIVANELLNNALKFLIDSPRPSDLPDCTFVVHSGAEAANGMPSGHSQFVGLWLSYTTASALWRPSRAGFYFVASSLVVGALVLVSRVTSQCHSIAQVAVGVAIGVCAGLLLFAAVRTTPMLYRL